MSARRLLWPLSLAFLIAVCAPAAARPLPAVTAVTETAANFDDDAGGEANADDPAIWVNPSRAGWTGATTTSTSSTAPGSAA